MLRFMLNATVFPFKQNILYRRYTAIIGHVKLFTHFLTTKHNVVNVSENTTRQIYFTETPIVVIIWKVKKM